MFSGSDSIFYLLQWIPQVSINLIFELKSVNIFLSISFNICFGCLKGLSHMFCLINKKNIFFVVNS